MTYALDVAFDARAACLTLDVEVQEAVFDLLDELARDGRSLKPSRQSHVVDVVTPTGRTFAVLKLRVVHRRQMLLLESVRAVVF